MPAEVRLYNPLFAKPDPNAANFAADLNPNSLEVLPTPGSSRDRALRDTGEAVQFERQGYFCPRPGLTRQAGVQSHRRLARYVGQNFGQNRWGWLKCSTLRPATVCFSRNTRD